MGEILPGNREAVEAWNTILFEKFARFRKLLVTAYANHGTPAIERHVPAEPLRVVDIGCGFGETTLELGRRVGPAGRVVGIDAASRFLDFGRAAARAAGLDHVTFEVADVEAGVPGGPYDLAYSRMGTMFFASPVIALRRVRDALVPGGLLCMIVWRKREANECFYAAEVAVRELLGDPPKQDQLTCGPGPFSMSSADLVSDQLLAAGYRDIAFERHDAPLRIGHDLDEAVAFALQIGPAGEVVRLAGDAALDRAAEIEEALRLALVDYIRPDGNVFAPSSVWFVTARRPE